MKAWSMVLTVWLLLGLALLPCQGRPSISPSGSPAPSQGHIILPPTPPPNLSGEWSGQPADGWSPTDNDGITVPIYSNETASTAQRAAPLVSPDRSMYAHFALLASTLILIGMAVGKALLDRVHAVPASIRHDDGAPA